MLDILSTIDEWLREGRQVALATVVDTWGSAPRQRGAKMGVSADMAMIGSVSGGCVETAVVEEALESLTKGKPRLLTFGVSDDTAWEVGLACGGKISVLVEPLDKGWWEKVAADVRQDTATVTATILDGELAGQKALVEASGVVYATEGLRDGVRDAVTQAASAALEKGGSERTQVNDLDVLLDVYRPRPRLVIVGGAHVAMALKNFAHLLGFRVFLIDPRKAFATSERFPDVELISHRYPDKALTEIGMTAETYIAILTHDPKIDDPALRAALPGPAPYVGILSSKRTHEKRIERLTKAGIDPELLKRIRTPIGLEIGAKTPEEIALCIMAEIIAVRNGVVV
jgi:xanthine dehydrogenase accessory factor